jgi:hypothetical protein
MQIISLYKEVDSSGSPAVFSVLFNWNYLGDLKPPRGRCPHRAAAMTKCDALTETHLETGPTPTVRLADASVPEHFWSFNPASATGVANPRIDRSDRHDTMFAPCRRSAFEKAVASSPSATTVPSFLVPALHTRRTFTSTTCRPSKLGRTPISIPPGVELMIGEPKVKRDPTNWRVIPKRTVTVTGPLGALDSRTRWSSDSLTCRVQDNSTSKSHPT